MSEVPVAVFGLLLGTALRVLVPYARAGLEEVAETGSFKAWPAFDWRYLALFLLPVLEFGVAFLTIDGLWRAIHSWAFVPSTMLGWSGADIGREVVGVAAAGQRIVARLRNGG